jgi:hypothetical protein
VGNRLSILFDQLCLGFAQRPLNTTEGTSRTRLWLNDGGIAASRAAMESTESTFGSIPQRARGKFSLTAGKPESVALT